MNFNSKIFLLASLALVCAVPLKAQSKVTAQPAPVRPRVFINPGHGGHDSNDRPEPFFNEGMQQRVPYYESDSNLAEGQALYDILRNKGYEVYMSRFNNTSQDDLYLFEISQMALAYGADVFFAIHSNDTGTSRRTNIPLALFRGYTDREAAEGSKDLALTVVKNLRNNQTSQWTGDGLARGDWSFYSWGYGVGLGVLRWNKVPGMLVESAFHDYLPERERFLNKDYSWNNAWLHSISLDEFFHRQGINQGVISGVVRYDYQRKGARVTTFGDDRYQPVNNIPVELCTPDGSVIASYQTDSYNNGFYSFTGLKPGNYTVEVDGAPSHPVTVKANAATYCNITIATIKQQGDTTSVNVDAAQ